MALVDCVRKAIHAKQPRAFIRLLISNAFWHFVALVLLRLPWDALTESSIELWFLVHPIFEITEFINVDWKKPMRELLLIIWLHLLVAFVLVMCYLYLSLSSAWLLVVTSGCCVVVVDILVIPWLIRRFRQRSKRS